MSTKSPSSAPVSSRPAKTASRAGTPVERIVWQRSLYSGAALGLALSAWHIAQNDAFPARLSWEAMSQGASWQSLCLSLIFTSALVGLLVAAIAAGWAGVCLLVWPRSTCAVRSAAGAGTFGVVVFLLFRSLVWFTTRGGRPAWSPDLGWAGLQAVAREPIVAISTTAIAVAGLFVVAKLFLLFVARPVEVVHRPNKRVGLRLLMRAGFAAGLLTGLLGVLTRPGMVRGLALNQTPELSLLGEYSAVASRASAARSANP